jgi:hypothetical protein
VNWPAWVFIILSLCCLRGLRRAGRQVFDWCCLHSARTVLHMRAQRLSYRIVEHSARVA